MYIYLHLHYILLTKYNHLEFIFVCVGQTFLDLHACEISYTVILKITKVTKGYKYLAHLGSRFSFD